MANMQRCLKCGKETKNTPCEACGFDIHNNSVIMIWGEIINHNLTFIAKKTAVSSHDAGKLEQNKHSDIKGISKGHYKVPCGSFFRNARTDAKREWELKNDTLYIRPYNGEFGRYQGGLPREIKNMVWRNARVLVIEDGIVETGSWEFSHLDVEEIVFPSSLKTIGFESFSTCKNLKEVNLPNGVETILSGAFESCAKLEKVNKPNGVKYIGDRAFSNTLFDKKNYSYERDIVETFHGKSFAPRVYPVPEKPEEKKTHKNAKYGMFNIHFDLEGYIGGVVSGNKEDDTGFLFYPNRNLLYCGGFKNNTKTGFGVLFDQYGYIEYAGTWKENLKDGFGYVREGDDFVLYDYSEGVCKNRIFSNRDGFPDSFNVISYDNVENNLTPKYVGTKINGIRDGFGVSITSGRIAYVGMWSNDKYSGHGRIMNYKTSYDDGCFKNGLRDGEFKTTYYNDDHTKKYEDQYRSYKDGERVKE